MIYVGFKSILHRWKLYYSKFIQQSRLRLALEWRFSVRKTTEPAVPWANVLYTDSLLKLAESRCNATFWVVLSSFLFLQQISLGEGEKERWKSAQFLSFGCFWAMLLRIALKLKVQGTLWTENQNFPEEDGVQLKEMPKCRFKCIKLFVFSGECGHICLT